MRDENYVTIPGWVFNRLNLTGNEAIVYSIIYGFSQNGEDWFEGSLKYICESIGTSKSTVLRTLKSLEEKGVIHKENYSIQNVVLARYKSCVDFEWGGVKMTPGGGVKMTPNNTSIDNTIPPINNKLFIPPTVSEVTAYLSEKGIKNVDAQQFVSFYESKGWMIGKNKMKNWHAAISTWERSNKQQSKNNKTSYTTSNADMDEWINQLHQDPRFTGADITNLL